MRGDEREEWNDGLLKTYLNKKIVELFRDRKKTAIISGKKIISRAIFYDKKPSFF